VSFYTFLSLQPNSSKGIFPEIQLLRHTIPQLSANLLTGTLPYHHFKM
jgi:hypothetical protein